MAKLTERWEQAKEQWWIWRTAHPWGAIAIVVSMFVLVAYWIGRATA